MVVWWRESGWRERRALNRRLARQLKMPCRPTVGALWPAAAVVVARSVELRACCSGKKGGAGFGHHARDVGLDSRLIGFDGEQAAVCLFAVGLTAAMMASFEQATGEGIVTTDGDRMYHESQGRCIFRLASTINLSHAEGR